MSYKETYSWDPETGSAIVKLTDDKNNIFLGQANCHPDDKEHMSKYFGLDLAEIRAKNNMLRYIRDTEVKPALRILEQLFTNMKTSKQFNPRSYEARMIRRKIAFLRKDLEIIKDIMATNKQYMLEMIHISDDFNARMGKNG